MSEYRSRFRVLLAVAAVACMSFASPIAHAIDRAMMTAYDGLAFAFNLAASIGARVIVSFMNIAPARADEMRPLERVKLTASQSRALSAAKRERPVIFAGWRMSPST